jgi:hypothetical protein
MHCGHVFCNFCDGHVCPVTLNVVKGPGPIIKCNRFPRGFEVYPHLFCDSGTDEKYSLLGAQMAKQLGAQKVAPNRKRSELIDKKVYERWKKSAKDREVYYTQYSPCADLAEEVLGAGQTSQTLSDDLTWQRSIILRTVALCEIHHAVGDAFSLTHLWQIPLQEFTCVRELLSKPGIVLLTWDECEYGRTNRNKQVMITNCLWLAWLDRRLTTGKRPRGGNH